MSAAAATNKHGYLLDLILLRTGEAPLHRAMEEAFAFLSLPPPTPDNGAPPRACNTLGSIPNVPPKPTLPAPRKALWHVHGRAVCFGESASGATLLIGEGIETVLSLVTPIPGILAAAALSTGSLGAFKPLQDISRLVIAREKDVEGRHAGTVLAPLCQTRHFPNRDCSRTLMISTTTSLLSDKTLRLGSRPILQASIPRERWKRGVGVGE